MRDAALIDLKVLAPTAEEVFKPASWMKKIDFVKRIILDNNVMISLLGEQNSGKTTFANVLKESLPPQINSYMISATPSFEPVVFLKQLDSLLGSKGEPTLSNFVAHSLEQKSHTLLIIDDAHHLSPEFIEGILREIQKQGVSAYFHVFMISNFSLIAVLNKFAQETYKDMIHSIEVGPLTEIETKSYLVRHLFLLKGLENLITDERVKQFYKLTEGHLLEINRQMTPFLSDKTKKTAGNDMLFRRLSVAAGVLLATTGTAYLWNTQSNFSAPTQLLSQQTPPLQEIVNGIAVSQAESNLTSDIPSYDVASIRHKILATPLHAGELAGNDKDEVHGESLVIMDKVIVAPRVLEKHAPLIKKSLKVAIHAALKPKITSVKLKPLIDQTYFTIQLLASHKKDELERFIERHHIQGKAKVHSTKRQGTVWYVLTVGEYAKRETAKQAVTHLPKDIAQFKPWVRPLADLKG